MGLSEDTKLFEWFGSYFEVVQVLDPKEPQLDESGSLIPLVFDVVDICYVISSYQLVIDLTLSVVVPKHFGRSSCRNPQ
jgi:hypothetical protein